jgi:hypothetical protein
MTSFATSFIFLFLSHMIGDWLIQTEHQAMNKAKGRFFNGALFSHCLCYTLCFVPAFWLAHINMVWLLLVFWSHMFLDRRWPVIWWIKTMKRTSEETIKNLFWLVIAVDQVMHILIVALIAYFPG